ncbi:galactose-specific lectin nattectin-like [Syngnathus acus]|uniref:galactose-specific lectin nattectin-like n=1 Tax=Syngnathus acus TaxID=161584 RepID=UPI001885B7F9|nr:galactose-specific lectin nattectin-like [Syngnathus acus]
MAFALDLLFLVCGISGLFTGVESVKSTPKIANSCPQGWTQLDCECYIYEAEPRSFADAESVCNILGGNLASIHNDLENAFIVEVIRANGDETEGWIGLHDAILDTDYIWTDGSDEDFLNFDTANSEPNALTGDCVEVDETDGLWQTASCTDLNVYVCIRDILH